MQIDLLISMIVHVLAGSIKVTFVDLDDGPVHTTMFFTSKGKTRSIEI